MSDSIAAILNPSIINAFCHRDYRDPDEVRIAIFPDRVEVRNPGTLMEGVTLRTLKTAKVSRRRNPLIADLLRRFSYSTDGSHNPSLATSRWSLNPARHGGGTSTAMRRSCP